MAKNWKKAHDNVARHVDGLSNALIDVQRERAAERDTLNARVKELEKVYAESTEERVALRHKCERAIDMLLGAAENMRANRLTSSARVIQDAVNDLRPNPTTAAADVFQRFAQGGFVRQRRD
jgi:hypothetical protein